MSNPPWRWVLYAIAGALILYACFWLIVLVASASAEGYGLNAGTCRQVAVTGYIRTEHSQYTADGTSVHSEAARDGELAAAPVAFLTMHSLVWIEGAGVRRIADRTAGWVDWPLIDVMVETHEQARWLNGIRWVCFIRLGEFGAEVWPEELR